MDTFVDWIITGGYPVEKIDDYPSWLTRFETAMRALPERQRAQSVLAVLDVYREPMLAIAGSPVPGARFRSAVEHSGRLVRGRHSLGTNGAAGRRPGGRRQHQEIPGKLEGIRP
jgi:thioester reductase-like protein